MVQRHKELMQRELADQTFRLQDNSLIVRASRKTLAAGQQAAQDFVLPSVLPLAGFSSFNLPFKQNLLNDVASKTVMVMRRCRFAVPAGGRHGCREEST